jgi:hypothetical protein
MNKYDVWFTIIKENNMIINTRFVMDATGFDAILNQIIYYANGEEISEIGISKIEKDINININSIMDWENFRNKIRKAIEKE